jgi:CRP/FNR family cyclic AMP-dependent transcriptional regulator
MLSTIEKVILLQDVEILESVSTDFLGQIALITEDVSFGTGEHIYEKNDISDAMYVVVNGKVRLHIGDREVMTALPKNSFGVWALFDEKERMVSATSIEDSHLLCLDKERFHNLLADNAEISRSVIASLAKRLRNLAQRVSLNDTNSK